MSGFDRRRLPGGGHALVSTDLEGVGYLAAFLERNGGRSARPYWSLNGSFGVGDAAPSVAANRAKVASAFGVPAFPVPGLVHGTRLMRAGPGRMADGFAGRPRAFASADGLHTRSRRMPLGAYSADCVIAIMVGPAEGRVALVHAGWRGLATGMIERAVALFADRRDLRVAIGPTIRTCHYEVGADVALAVAAGSSAGAVTERRRGRLYLDLVGTTKAVLRELGVRRVWDTGLCTACERRRFFSYRRDGTTGRHMALGMRLE